jgi:rhodanese-related sulfurtransferase
MMAPAPDEISAVELARRLARGEVLLVLDVRESVERGVGAIPIPPTAADLHIPMSEIPARLDEIRAAAARGPMVVYCHHGVRSAMVTGWLQRQGVGDVSSLAGGIDDWSTSVDASVARY